MKHLIFPALFIILISCNNTATEELIEPEVIDQAELSDEELIKRNVESRLSIKGNEDYSLTIYEGNLNGDENPDKVIAVNLLDRALKEAIESGNVVKRAELGYMGKFNYLFFMDGQTKEISEPIAVASSPHAKLSVQFANIRSEAYQDVMVDFRVRNSCFRRFYTLINNQPRQTFEMKIFDGLGTPTTEAYYAKFEPGSYSLAKDIVVYKGLLEEMTFEDPMGIYKAQPEIEQTKEFERRWFFNDHERKYFTEK